MTACWGFHPDERPEPETIIHFITGIPNLITPLLDTPMAAVAMEGTDSLEINIHSGRRHTAISRSLTGSTSASAVLQHLSATNPESVKLLTQGLSDGLDATSISSHQSSVISGTFCSDRCSTQSLASQQTANVQRETEYVQIAATPELDTSSEGSKLYNSDKICPLNNHVHLKYIQPNNDNKGCGDSDYGSDYSKEVTSQV